MDPVRFGRALGVGARLAAKTAASAVDAALAPNPATPRTGSTSPNPPIHQASAATASTPSPVPPPDQRPLRSTQASQSRPSPARPSPRRLSHAFTIPLRRLSGVLWLEFTGVFFGLFATAATLGAWRLRFAWRSTPANATDHLHLLLTLATAALFTYFCFTSFLRASRRNRQP